MSTTETPATPTAGEQAVTEAAVLDALRVIQDPDLRKDIVALKFVKNVRICGGVVALDIELTTPACPVKDRLREEAVAALKALPGVTEANVTMTAQVRKSQAPPTDGGMKHVKNAIAIASGKGGVGKSTVATNLAVALAKMGATVGLMDADVYGPSVSTMFGGGERPEVNGGSNMIKPVLRHGVRYISMGLLTGKDTPVIWRGPMATKLIQQFLGQVEWGELDYLLIDLPPGTGDVQLTLTQSAPLCGAVIVTTPQDVAVGVTLRGLRMFEQVHVPILGIVENMAGFHHPTTGEIIHIFKQGGGKKAADELGFTFLGAIPLDASIATAGDAGVPLCAMDGLTTGKPAADAFRAIAAKLASQISIVNEATASTRWKPAEVRASEEVVEIRWTDGHASYFPFRDLRVACPCAECVDEWTGERRLDPKSIPLDVTPLEVRGVGRYALQFIWSDGHSTGIYTYDKLRAMDKGAPLEPPKPLKKLPLIQGAPPKAAAAGHGHDHGHGHHHHGHSH